MAGLPLSAVSKRRRYVTAIGDDNCSNHIPNEPSRNRRLLLFDDSVDVVRNGCWSGVPDLSAAIQRPTTTERGPRSPHSTIRVRSKRPHPRTNVETLLRTTGLLSTVSTPGLTREKVAFATSTVSPRPWGARRGRPTPLQVAVTTSLADPGTDLEGKLASGPFTAQRRLGLRAATWRLRPRPRTRNTGTPSTIFPRGRGRPVSERRSDLRRRNPQRRFRSTIASTRPYGASILTANFYVLDYAHRNELRAATFRMSCIYGPRQFGNGDKGGLHRSRSVSYATRV